MQCILVVFRPNDQSPEAVSNLLRALQNLVNDTLKYNGSDQSAFIDVLRLTMTVLMSVLSENPIATRGLQILMSALRTPANAVTTRQPSRRCDTQQRGLLDLGSIVCTVENVISGQSIDSGLVGTVQNLLGGVLNQNSGRGLLGGSSSGGNLAGGALGGNLLGGNLGGNLLGGNLGLLGSLLGGNRGILGPVALNSRNGNGASGDLLGNLLNGRLG